MTVITQMLTAGVTLPEVMVIVGHASLKTTQRYVRRAGIMIAGATDKLKYELF